MGIAAIVVFIAGAISMLVSLRDVKRRRRIIATPTSPIAQAPGNGLVEINGRILPSEQGLLQAPFSGRQVVWCRVTVQEVRSSGRHRTWHTIIEEVEFRSFMVDDGSGQQARVLPTNAKVILEKQNVASSGTFNDAPPELEAFLQARGKSSTGWLGLNKSMRYQEEVLSPDDPLYALGPSRREAGPPVHDQYRTVPSSQLVMFGATSTDDELLLTNKTEQQLTRGLLTSFLLSLVFVGIGVVLGIVALTIG